MNNEPNYDNDKIITLFNQFTLTITYKNNLILTMLINYLILFRQLNSFLCKLVIVKTFQLTISLVLCKFIYFMREREKKKNIFLPYMATEKWSLIY